MSDNVESGMVFVRTTEGFFNVEKCPTIENLGDGVKICEFFSRLERHGKPKLVLVEAKSSAPMPPDQGGDSSKWGSYNTAIYEKMVNSLLIYLGLKIGREYPVSSVLPPAIESDDLSSISILPCLVLRDHPDWALPPIQDELRSRLSHIVKSFHLESPIAINHDMAVSIGLVEAETQ